MEALLATVAKLLDKTQDQGVVQVDTVVDSYYLSNSLRCLKAFCTAHKADDDDDVDALLLHESNQWTEKEHAGEKPILAWIADHELCIAAKPVPHVLLVEKGDFCLAVQHLFRILGTVTFSDLRAVCYLPKGTGNNRVMFMSHVNHDADEILAAPSLLLGSMRALRSMVPFYDCVVNCTGNVAQPPHITPSRYVQMYWEDSSSFTILKPELYEALHRVHTWRARGLRVLIHCEQGISRSAAFVIAYLLHYGLLPTRAHAVKEQKGKRVAPVDEAVTFLQSRRRIVSPNRGFRSQLLQLRVSDASHSYSADPSVAPEIGMDS